MQRIAEGISRIAEARGEESFDVFLLDLMQAVKRAGTHSSDDVGDLFTGNIRKWVFERVARFLALGKHSPEALLHSNSRDAVEICETYVQTMASRAPLNLVIQQAEYIDIRSLRTLLRLARELPSQHYVLEYTCKDQRIIPHHDRVLQPEYGRDLLSIIPLRKLENPYFQQLMTRWFGAGPDYDKLYQKWSGDIRSLECKRRTEAILSGVPSTPLTVLPPSMLSQIGDSFVDLNAIEKTLIGICVAQTEPISSKVLTATALTIHSVSETAIAEALTRLVKTRFLLRQSYGMVEVAESEVGDAVSADREFAKVMMICRKALRDFYINALQREDHAIIAASDAVRYAFALSAETGDIASLQRLLTSLSETIRAGNDQSAYIRPIVEILRGTIPFGAERMELTAWAAVASYEIGDYAEAARLLESLERDAALELLFACCLQELGRGEDALRSAQRIEAIAPAVIGEAASNLVRFLVLRDEAKIDQARLLLSKMGRLDSSVSPLLGYALRFSECVNDFPTAAQNVARSVNVFHQFGLHSAEGYSHLAAAGHAARQGLGVEAKEHIKKAVEAFGDRLHDRHMVLNNAFVVAYFGGDRPTAQWHEMLSDALLRSKDDYATVAILNNLAIALWLAGETDKAVQAADSAVATLRHAPFGDQDIRWPVVYNAEKIYRRAGKSEAATAVATFLDRMPMTNGDYWKYRLDESSTRPEGYEHMLRFEWHPIFLSHWLIEYEAIRMLTSLAPQ